MTLSRRTIVCLLPLYVACAYPSSTYAQKAERPILTSAEAKVVGTCLDIIRGCQLADGSFNMVCEGKAPQNLVWIAPYFAQYSMLALLAANDCKKNSDDVARVGKWLDWCATHQDKDGFWYDHTGTIASYNSNGKVDAYDSSAATFLLVVERYQRSGAKLSPKVVAAAKASLNCITNLADTDGLTSAKPDYKVKYLMDNVEVFAGLSAAQTLFTKTQDVAEAAIAGKHVAAISKSLLAYWEAAEKERFAWALYPNGTFDGGLDQFYPHGLAQLFGVSFVAAKPDPFAETCKAFKPQTTREGLGAERFLIAASTLGGVDVAFWRSKVVKDAATFTPESVYIVRPGLVILALMEGADWMPCVANYNAKKKPNSTTIP